MRWCWVLCVLAGCVSPGEFIGAYDGTLTSTEKQDTMTFMMEGEHEVFVAPSQGGALAIQLRDDCAVTASIVDAENFEFSAQRCEHEGSSTMLDVQASGTGVLSGSTLTVTFTLAGTLVRGDQTIDFESDATFVGAR